MRLACLLVAMSSMGCLSTSTMGLARTLNKGAVQGWAAVEGGGVVAVAPTASTGGVPVSTASGTGYPMVEGGVRFGASDHVELGARLGFNGIGIEGKVAFLRSPTMDSGLNLSINPQVGFFGVTLGSVFFGVISAQLPVLFGIDFGGHELVFGPKLHNQLYLAGTSGTSADATAAIDLLSVGGSVGFAIKLGPVRLMPEVSFIVPFFASGAVTGSSAVSGVGLGGFAFQGGIALLFGTREGYERPEPVPMSPPPMPVPLDAPPPMPVPANDAPPPMPPPSSSP